MQYGVATPNGQVIHDPGWTSEADVIAAQHGLALLTPGGDLVARETPADEWRTVHQTGGPRD